ncbi:MAG TPA: HlyD family type I secretion periplasmic adaptor subunit [Novosphingobium sp.]|uniref:HlyD family type I secretion periplasmic adaptor subunit n=1 Tax=Rhizorhapis sp. TaxID=1968842 RepID=UPI002B48F87F|nr:HlyD family type I secretion periplasmic adaptor subunit [Rhizorhapis sp.]HKR16883.1 HlyD family type I secretion periplasmic adaptor subunit [Rhizorhapis sp.]HKX78720.1 HlyD family type I secretion periplasmic adaptor subunit [Novosphingobium sp.]
MSGLAHSWRVIREALKADRERRRNAVLSADAEFLPAALEVIETPVSPTGRLTTWILLAGLVVTILWLVLGRVDVVSSAPGKLMPAGSVKIVQSAGSGVIRSILVHDGDHVRKGQLLIELDTTLATAELQQAEKALLSIELDVARNRAIADALSGRGGAPHFVAPAGTPPEIAETQRRLVDAQVGEVLANVGGLEAARRSALSEADAASATRAKLDETIPILDHELAAMQRLDENGYAPGLRLLELQRQRRSEAGDRDVAVAQHARGLSEAGKMSQQIGQTREQARRIALADLAKAESEVVLRREDVIKARRRTGLQRLYAAEDGTVQQLAVHTIGGVVEPARTLMVIVPARGGIELEAHVLNKDAGFVREGQDAVVKLDAFPFTRYGTIPAKVVSLSRDAVPDPKLGPTYVARVRLSRASLIVDGKPVALGSGLNAVADIRTGSRRIISWLLSPVQTTVAQAARER